MWPQGTVFDAHLYISADNQGVDFEYPEYPHATFTGLKLGDWKWKEAWDTEIQLPRSVQNNGTLYLNTFLTRNGASVDSRKPGFLKEDVHYSRKPLMNYQRMRRERAVKNLITGSADEETETVAEAMEKERAMPIIS